VRRTMLITESVPSSILFDVSCCVHPWCAEMRTGMMCGEVWCLAWHAACTASLHIRVPYMIGTHHPVLRQQMCQLNACLG
jgi:hypothetical protein